MSTEWEHERALTGDYETVHKGNAASSYQTVKVALLFNQTCYIAGSDCTGRLEIVYSGTEGSIRAGRVSTELNITEGIPKGPSVPLAKVPCILLRGFDISKGRHVLPFRMPIPSGVPSTLSSQRAYVSAVVSGVINLPGGFIRIEEKIRIFENAQAEYEDGPGLSSLASANKNGEVVLSARLAKYNFTAGEPVFVRIEVENKSSRKFSGLKLQLIRRLTPTKGKETDKVYETTNCDVKVEAREKRGMVLNLPGTPWDLGSCLKTTLFTVVWFVGVSLDTGLMHKNLTVMLPLRITPALSANAALMPTENTPTLESRVCGASRDSSISPSPSGRKSVSPVRDRARSASNDHRRRAHSRSPEPPILLNSGDIHRPVSSGSTLPVPGYTGVSPTLQRAVVHSHSGGGGGEAPPPYAPPVPRRLESSSPSPSPFAAFSPLPPAANPPDDGSFYREIGDVIPSAPPVSEKR